MPSARLAVQGPRHDAVVRPLWDRLVADGDERGLPGSPGSGPDRQVPAARPARRVPAGLDDHPMDADLECGRGRRSGHPLRPGTARGGRLLARQGDPQDRADRSVRGARRGRRRRDGRLALRRPVRRPACGAARVRGRDGRRPGPAVRAPGRGVDRSRRGGGDRDRPHRPGLRRRGLPARQGARSAGRGADRRGWHLRRRVRVAVGTGRARRRRADHRAPQARRPLLPTRDHHPPLPALLALWDAARLPPRRRVVHQHGPAVRPAARDADGRTGRRQPPLPDHGGGGPDPLDPRFRVRARARLAPQHARLDDQQEALLGARAADLRLRGVRDGRGHRRARGAQAARGRGLGGVRGPQPASAVRGRGQDRLSGLRGARRADPRRREPVAGRRDRAVLDAPLPRGPRLLAASGSRPTSSPRASRGSSATGSTRCSRWARCCAASRRSR